MIRFGHARSVFSLLFSLALPIPVAVFPDDVTIGGDRPTTLHVPPSTTRKSRCRSCSFSTATR